ncbi:class I SAM-dependent methyltransferase [Dehalococcoidia bacterium]|nr:class I SAM-dependent methyltransferase [Dehalococcoidia bacterium]
MMDDRNGPAGNYYPKFSTRNPISRLLVSRFKQSLSDLTASLGASSVLEVGCGEGFLAEFMLDTCDASYTGVDVDLLTTGMAKDRSPAGGFAVADGLSLPFRAKSFDLVLACEVMEHVWRPEDLLQEVRRVSREYCLFSVPREPLWRMLNVARGAYISNLGNTPGHIQHWRSGEFHNLLQRHVKIIRTKHPIPWTMVLCQV